MLRTAPRISVAFAIAVVMAVGGPGGSAQAATIVVNGTADMIADDGQCTLREAIIAANNDAASGASGGECAAGSGDDTITLPAGTYTLTLGSELIINTTMTVTGAGAEGTIIQASSTPGVANSRVFTVTSGNASISHVTVRHGNAAAFGGGINNVNGAVTLSNSTVTDNVSNDLGGGVYNEGTMTIVNTTIRNNTSTVNPGGGISNFGTLTLDRSTVRGNYAGGAGGIFTKGALTAIDSTISGNATVGEGGGVLNFGMATLISSTVSNNSAITGGGVHAGTGTVNIIRNSIIAANIAPGTGPDSRVPGSGVIRGRGSGERETTASSLAGKEESSRTEENSGQGKDGPAGAIAQGGNGR